MGLLEAAQLAKNDPTILSHRDNIAFLDSLFSKTAEALRPPMELWTEALALIDQALGGESPSLALLENARDLLREGAANACQDDRLIEIADEMRKHREAESKRESRLSQAITAREVQWIMGQLVDILKKVITNQDIPRERIPEATGLELVRIFGHGVGRGTGLADAGTLN